MRGLILLLIATVAFAADVPPSLLLPHKNLLTAMDQVVTMCANAAMDIVQQTRNTITCHLMATTLRYTLVQLSTGVRVSWTQDPIGYNGMQVDGIANDLVRNAILAAGK